MAASLEDQRRDDHDPELAAAIALSLQLPPQDGATLVAEEGETITYSSDEEEDQVAEAPAHVATTQPQAGDKRLAEQQDIEAIRRARLARFA